MKNTIKRIISCLSAFAVCCIANLGLPTKAISQINTNNTKNIANIVTGKQDTLSNSFVLYSGNELGWNNNAKLADHYSHYSHSSHVSHQSHYSSRY